MSRLRIVRRVAARVDVLEAADHIARADPRAAIRFVRSVRETEEALPAFPGMGSSRDYDNPAFTGMPFHPVRGFRRHLVFYMARGDGIEVIRVLHGARNLEALFSA